MSTQQQKKNVGVVVALVPSESSSVVLYKIRKVDSGALTCSCMSFRFATGHIGSSSKTCKHIRRIR